MVFAGIRLKRSSREQPKSLFQVFIAVVMVMDLGPWSGVLRKIDKAN